MTKKDDNIEAVQYILASIFASQRALRTLAPQFKWAGLGNLLGDFGEFVAIAHYNLSKAPPGSDGFDAITAEGKKVQIKTNYAASQIGFRGVADLLLVIGVEDDGSWQEIYFGPFSAVKDRLECDASFDAGRDTAENAVSMVSAKRKGVTLCVTPCILVGRE